MFKKYKIDNLFIAQMYRVETKYGKNYTKNIDYYIIVKKINNLVHEHQEQYQEIFTKTNYRIPSSIYSHDGELVVGNVFSITPFCNEEELLKGKIIKKRLIEIYRTSNKDLFEKEVYEYDDEVKELMKKYDN